MIPDHDLVLHVGMPKASAVLVPALEQLRPQLRARGVAVLTEVGPGPGLSTQARAERERAGMLWRRRAVPVVVASERLLGEGDIGRRDADRLRPGAARALRHVIEALSARKVLVLLHTQRQDRLLELAYLRWLGAGHAGSIEDLFGELHRPVLDYGDLVERLRSVPRVTDVVVRPVELLDAGVHAFVNDALSPLGLRDLLDLHRVRTDLFVRPPVYSAQGAALARALNPLVRGPELATLQAFLGEKYPAKAEYGPPDILDPVTRADVLAAYADANRRLFTRHLADLPPDSYASEVATFDLGNVLQQPASRRPADRRVIDAVALGGSAASHSLRRGAAYVARRIPQAQRERLERLRRRP